LDEGNWALIPHKAIGDEERAAVVRLYKDSEVSGRLRGVNGGDTEVGDVVTFF
jgi:hypothetical protein